MKKMRDFAKKLVVWYLHKYRPAVEVEWSNVNNVIKDGLIDWAVGFGFWAKDVLLMGAFITLALTPVQGFHPVNGLYAFGIWLAFEIISEVKKKISG